MQEQDDGMGVVLVEMLLWALLLPCLPKWKQQDGSLRLFYPYAHILFRRAPSHDLITPERSHFLRLSHWSLQFQHVNFGGRKIVYSNRQSLHCVMGNPYYMSCEIMLASLAYTRDK